MFIKTKAFEIKTMEFQFEGRQFRHNGVIYTVIGTKYSKNNWILLCKY